MKKIVLFAIVALGCMLAGVSCAEDDLNPNSVIVEVTSEPTPLDAWLYDNFVTPYNIEFAYRYQDMESDMVYNLTPASYEKSVQMAKLVRHLCLQSYDEVTGSQEFIRNYFPKMIYLVGSPAYNNNGSVVLGTAEGGTKITLYAVNRMDPTDVNLLNEWYFKTIHHEFAHILHQTKPYSTDFDQITGTSESSRYVGNDCWDVYATESAALKAGFISRYAATSADEDFVELISIYVTNTASTWSSMLSTAGSTGRSMIESKFEIAYKYMQNEWNIDLDQLREVVLRRQAEVPSMDLDTL